MVFYKTFEEALECADNYEPQWLCPIDKELCNINCYCYQEPDVFGDEPEDGEPKYYITTGSCRHFLHDRHSLWLVEKLDELIRLHLKKMLN